jgi:hypothetical protein
MISIKHIKFKAQSEFNSHDHKASTRSRINKTEASIKQEKTQIFPSTSSLIIVNKIDAPFISTQLTLYYIYFNLFETLIFLFIFKLNTTESQCRPSF